MTVDDKSTALGWDGHLLLLPASASEREAALAAWARDGLERDEQVIYAQDGAADGASLVTILEANGLDTAAARAEGRLRLIEPVDAVAPGSWAAIVDEALAGGRSRLRISGDRDGLTATTKAAARLEQELEDLCRTRPVSVLCRYTGPSDAGGPLDQVAAAHAGGLRERQLQTTMQPGRLMLTGEVDLANEAILAPVLMAAAVAGDGLLRVDLEQVSFLSVGGCRALAVATSRFRAEGGWVELRHPQFIVEQALRMSGIDTLANVEVIGSHP